MIFSLFTGLGPTLLIMSGIASLARFLFFCSNCVSILVAAIMKSQQLYHLTYEKKSVSTVFLIKVLLNQYCRAHSKLQLQLDLASLIPTSLPPPPPPPPPTTSHPE